jgi:hypothetical protein
MDCGLEVGDQIRMSREACAGRSRLDPGGDEVRGSSSVVVGLATTLPPSPSGEEPGGPGSGTGAEALSAKLKAGGRRAERAHCGSEFFA